jgi:hypothetical protein
MLRAKKNDVIAIGPVFPGSGAKETRRRVVLVKSRDAQGDTKEYIVITKRKVTPGPRGVASTRRETAKDFTHAVRMFCDHILEQAWRDDLEHEEAHPAE